MIAQRFRRIKIQIDNRLVYKISFDSTVIDRLYENNDDDQLRSVNILLLKKYTIMDCNSCFYDMDNNK